MSALCAGKAGKKRGKEHEEMGKPEHVTLFKNLAEEAKKKYFKMRIWGIAK